MAKVKVSGFSFCSGLNGTYDFVSWDREGNPVYMLEKGCFGTKNAAIRKVEGAWVIETIDLSVNYVPKISQYRKETECDHLLGTWNSKIKITEINDSPSD